MDVDGVREILQRLKVDELDYRVLDAPGDSTWCIRKQGSTWLVFFFERGRKYDLERFQNEHSACEYFLNKLAPNWKTVIS